MAEAEQDLQHVTLAEGASAQLNYDDLNSDSEVQAVEAGELL